MTYHNRDQRKRVVGYPARIFTEMSNYGKIAQEPNEKLTILFKWYSHLSAYLPVFLKNRTGKEELEKNYRILSVLLPEAKVMIRAIRDFEMNLNDYNDVDQLRIKRAFVALRIDFFEKLDEITALSGVIDDVELQEESDEV